MGITSSGTTASVPWSRVAAVRLAQGMRALKMLPVGTRAVLSSLMTKMSSMWKARPYSSCLLLFSPQLLSLWLSPSSSLCLFLQPSEQWKKQSPVLGCRDAFLPRESQTISTAGPGIFTGGHILGRKKQVSWENGEGKLCFLSLRNLGDTCKLAIVGVQGGSVTRLDLVLRTFPQQ